MAAQRIYEQKVIGASVNPGKYNPHVADLPQGSGNFMQGLLAVAAQAGLHANELLARDYQQGQAAKVDDADLLVAHEFELWKSKYMEENRGKAGVNALYDYTQKYAEIAERYLKDSGISENETAHQMLQRKLAARGLMVVKEGSNYQQNQRQSYLDSIWQGNKAELLQYAANNPFDGDGINFKLQEARQSWRNRNPGLDDRAVFMPLVDDIYQQRLNSAIAAGDADGAEKLLNEWQGVQEGAQNAQEVQGQNAQSQVQDQANRAGGSLQAWLAAEDPEYQTNGNAQNIRQSNAQNLGSSAAPTLGSVVNKSETGGKGTAMVSTGYGDHGGVSYGRSQLASNIKGSIDSFLNWARSHGFADIYNALNPLKGDATNRNGAFAQKWKELASGGRLQEADRAYQVQGYYMPMLRKIQKADPQLARRIGANPALQEQVLSTSVQYGQNSGRYLSAAKEVLANNPNATDRELLIGIQDIKARDVGKNFKSSGAAVQASVRNRHANTEKKELLALMDQGGQIPARPGVMQSAQEGSIQPAPTNRQQEPEDSGSAPSVTDNLQSQSRELQQIADDIQDVTMNPEHYQFREDTQMVEGGQVSPQQRQRPVRQSNIGSGNLAGRYSNAKMAHAAGQIDNLRNQQRAQAQAQKLQDIASQLREAAPEQRNELFNNIINGLSDEEKTAFTGPLNQFMGNLIKQEKERFERDAYNGLNQLISSMGGTGKNMYEATVRAFAGRYQPELADKLVKYGMAAFEQAEKAQTARYAAEAEKFIQDCASKKMLPSEIYALANQQFADKPELLKQASELISGVASHENEQNIRALEQGMILKDLGKLATEEDIFNYGAATKLTLKQREKLRNYGGVRSAVRYSTFKRLLKEEGYVRDENVNPQGYDSVLEQLISMKPGQEKYTEEEIALAMARAYADNPYVFLPENRALAQKYIDSQEGKNSAEIEIASRELFADFPELQQATREQLDVFLPQETAVSHDLLQGGYALIDRGDLNTPEKVRAYARGRMTLNEYKALRDFPHISERVPMAKITGALKNQVISQDQAKAIITALPMGKKTYTDDDIQRAWNILQVEDNSGIISGKKFIKYIMENRPEEFVINIGSVPKAEQAQVWKFLSDNNYGATKENFTLVYMMSKLEGTYLGAAIEARLNAKKQAQNNQKK